MSTLLSMADGSSICVISALRLVWLYPISIAKDVTYESPLSALWSSVELNVGILCACIPTLKSCFVKLFPRLLGITRSQQRSSPSAPIARRPTLGHTSKQFSVQELSLPDLESNSSMGLKSPPLPSPPLPSKSFKYLSCGGVASTEALDLHEMPKPSAPPLTALPPLPQLHVPARESRRVVSLPERLSSRRYAGRANSVPAPSRRESTLTLVRSTSESVMSDPQDSPVKASPYHD